MYYNDIQTLSGNAVVCSCDAVFYGEIPQGVKEGGGWVMPQTMQQTEMTNRKLIGGCIETIGAIRIVRIVN